jgi:hypothetical protein
MRADDTHRAKATAEQEPSSMTAILFDSRKTSKPAKFGRGLLRFIPSSTTFEPSDEDRAWAAREFADSERKTAELQFIENRAARIASRRAECRAAATRYMAILNDQPIPQVSAFEPFQPSASDWSDYARWCARLDEMNDGIELEPRSTPISDEDINIVNVAG